MVPWRSLNWWARAGTHPRVVWVARSRGRGSAESASDRARARKRAGERPNFSVKLRARRMPRPFPSRMFYGFPVISARAALLGSSSFPKIRSFDLECLRRVINPFHPRYFKQFIPWGVPLKMTDYCVASEFLFCHYRPTQTGGAFLVVLDPRMCVPGRSL